MTGGLAALRRRLQLMGFEGPAYRGVRGKLRFVLESTLWREETVFVATRESYDAVEDPTGPDLELIPIERFEDVAPFRAELEQHYYAGYTDRWRGPFQWGERAVIGRLEGKVASFNFFQLGTRAGHPTYWGRLLADDARTEELPRPNLPRHGLIGHDGNPHPDPHQRLDDLHVLGLHDDWGGDSLAREELFNKVPGH